MSTLSDMADRVHNAGLAVRGTSLFYGSQAAIPDVDTPVVLLAQYAAGNPRFTHDGALATIGSAFVQVLVRGADYDTVDAKARAVLQELGKIRNEPPYLAVETLQPEPFSLGASKDDQRAELVFNLEIHKRAS